MTAPALRRWVAKILSRRLRSRVKDSLPRRFDDLLLAFQGGLSFEELRRRWLQLATMEGVEDQAAEGAMVRRVQTDRGEQARPPWVA